MVRKIHLCVDGEGDCKKRKGSYDRHRVHIQGGVVETQSKIHPHSLCVSAAPSLGWIHLHCTCLLRQSAVRNLFYSVNLSWALSSLLSHKGSIE